MARGFPDPPAVPLTNGQMVGAEIEQDREQRIESSNAYPSTNEELKEERRNYRDIEAAAMFKATGGVKLNQAHATMCSALVRQAEKLEQFHSTPFTGENIEVLRATLDGIEQLRRTLTEWHYLINPNQRKGGEGT